MIVMCFKQKTAYEMRISDWRSDVGSSDLGGPADAGHRGPAHGLDQTVVAAARQHRALRAQRGGGELEGCMGVVVEAAHQAVVQRVADAEQVEAGQHAGEEVPALLVQIIAEQRRLLDQLRSEEHTSELQSLMRISYAVFCLKKKKKKQHK